MIETTTKKQEKKEEEKKNLPQTSNTTLQFQRSLSFLLGLSTESRGATREKFPPAFPLLPSPFSSLPFDDKGKEKLTDTEGWHETREENTHERNNGRVWMERWHASGPHPSIPKQNARTYQSSYEQLLCVMEGVPGVTY